MSTCHRIILVWLLLFGSFVVNAKKVRLITIGPGHAFWSAFGHTAIAIENDVYGFGYFSFEDDVITEFISNRMQYELGVSDINRELFLAEQQNRDFSMVQLNLSSTQVKQVEDYLKWHNQPENQAYHYDYFLNNCSTKVRDILNNAWQDQLGAVSQIPANSSYFEQTFPAKQQGLMNFGLAIGYGWSAYQERSAWELMAFPVFFEQQLLNLMPEQIDSHELLFESTANGLFASFISTHWTVVSYVLLWSLMMLFPKVQMRATKFWFIWHGIIGLLLLGLWLLTPHQAMALNFNVLLFTPLGFLVNRGKLIKPMILCSYVLWFVLAWYLGAWYLMFLLFPAIMALSIVNKNSDLVKPRLSFAGVNQ